MNNAQEAKMTAYAEEIRKRYEMALIACHNVYPKEVINASLADIRNLLEVIEEQRLEIERLKGLSLPVAYPVEPGTYGRTDGLLSVLAKGKALLDRTAWQSIETAPKTGEHILVAQFDGGIGFGLCGGKQQAFMDVVHWWSGPYEPGFYPSYGPDEPYECLTHWMPLPES